jgi:hypothetical protein
MATRDEPSGTLPTGRPARDEAARARAYLDLWERHLTQSAVDGPIEARPRLPE